MDDSEGRQRNAVVVGGASGIGAATCDVLAQRGWRVVVTDINVAGAEAVAQRTGGVAASFDVRDADGIEAKVAAIEAAHGPTHAMVICAALFQKRGPIEAFPHEDWDRIMNSNLRGTYLADLAFARRMATRGTGAIVNLSSLSGLRSTTQHAYSTSKAGVNMITEGMAAEWGRSGVRVNAVAPGYVSVPRMIEQVKAGGRYVFPPEEISALGRMVEPREVGETIAFLLSDRASAVTGATLLVDAGTAVAMSWHIYGGAPPARPQSG